MNNKSLNSQEEFFETKITKYGMFKELDGYQRDFFSLNSLDKSDIILEIICKKKSSQQAYSEKSKQISNKVQIIKKINLKNSA